LAVTVAVEQKVGVVAAPSGAGIRLVEGVLLGLLLKDVVHNSLVDVIGAKKVPVESI